MMKRLYKYICICLLVGLVACSEEERLMEQSSGQKITATAVGSEGESVFSRLGYTDQQDGGVTITWAEGDQFYMKGSNGASATMAILDGIGEKKARFTGTLLGTMTDGESVTAYYPAAAYDAENGCFNIDLRSITQDCTSGNEMNHLSATYFMIGSGNNYEGDVEVSFVGGTQVAMLRFDLTLPQQKTSGLTIDELQIVCEDLKTVGTLAADGTFTGDEPEESHRQKVLLENLSASTVNETTFSVYVNVLPTKITGNMRLKAMLNDETVYWCDVDLTDVELKANNRYYLVRGFLEEQKVGIDYSWYTADKSATEFHIYDEADLRGLSNIVNYLTPTEVGYSNFNNKTIVLENDIDLKVDWIPIGYNDNFSGYRRFRGTFDGNNKVISGIYCDNQLLSLNYVEAVGFFGVTMGATIKDLTLKGIVKSDKQYTGGIVGRNINGDDALTVVENCRNEIHVSSTYSGGFVGGVIGYAWGASIIKCSNSGTLHAISGNARLGGIVGGFSGQSSSNKIVACYNEGSMVASSSDARIGGIVGFYYEGRSYKVPLIACFNLTENLLGDASEISYQGGIIGYVKSTTSRMHYVYGCYSISQDLFGYTNTTEIDDESCLVFTPDKKNSEDNAALLNTGILNWNTKEDGVNGDATHAQYCNFHFEVGETHLIIKEGAPTASTETEEQ